MPAPIEFIEHTKPENPWRECNTVAAVGPLGQFCHRHIPQAPRLASLKQGDVPITADEGEGRLSPRYARAGWVLYEDLCAGRVDGIASSPKHWRIWQRYIEAKARGLNPGTVSDDDFFHPEVVRRRQLANHGALHMDPAATRSWLGLDELEEVDILVEEAAPEHKAEEIDGTDKPNEPDKGKAKGKS